MTLRTPAALLLLASLAQSLAALQLPIPQLPILSFPPQSDWRSVKGAPFFAKGDGVSDDTAAIQAALSVMGYSQQYPGNATLYFPAGTYLITKTLHLNETLGASLFGTGRTSILRWGAGRAPTASARTLLGGGWPPDPPFNVSRLFWSSGNTRFYMEGLVLDGRAGACGVGIDHATPPGGAYEGGLTHRNLHFTGFFVAGIRVGTNQPPHGQDVASAEIQYTNCIFDHCRAGVSLLAWNDFDNMFSGCVFSDNSYGIECIAGNYYVQNSRFQASNVTDALITAHSSSIRRSVSVGSAAFLLQTDNNAFGSAIKVVECLVSGWGSAAAPSAAILFQTRGPAMLIDSVFEAPAHAASPALALRNSTSRLPDAGLPGFGGQFAAVIVINATMRGAAGPLLDGPSTALLGPHLYTAFPPGDAALAAQLAPLSPSTQFFNPNWPQVPAGARVFDAVRDFGADPAGRESGRQLQACLDAAAAAAAAAPALGAVCYLPLGGYSTNATLALCGSGVTLLGGNSGFRTSLHWAGPFTNDSVVLATGPGAGCAQSNVTIQRLTVQAATVGLAIARPAALPASYIGADRTPTYQRHGAVALRGGGAPAPRVRVVLDNVYAIGPGVVVAGLEAGDTVSGWKLDGNAEVWDSDAAIVLLSYLAFGGDGLTVARSPGALAPPPAARAAGLCGAAIAVASSSLFDIRLYNSSSLVLGSHYTETSFSHIFAEGDGVSPRGTVAIDHSKLNYFAAGRKAPCIQAQGYAGTIFTHGATGAQAFTVAAGAAGAVPAALDFAVLGMVLEDNATAVGGAGLTEHSLGCIVAPYEAGPPPYALQGYYADHAHASTGAVVQAALDRLRWLGIVDLRLNFPAAVY